MTMSAAINLCNRFGMRRIRLVHFGIAVLIYDLMMSVVAW